MELLLPDSTVIRANPCAAGALKKSGGQENQASGRCRGGFGTGISAAADASGNPPKFIPAPGQSHDITEEEALTAEQFRHIFSRFDKLSERYLSFLHFAGALIWLR